MTIKRLDFNGSELICVLTSVTSALKRWQLIMDSGDENHIECEDEMKGIIEQVKEVMADRDGLNTALATLGKLERKPLDTP